MFISALALAMGFLSAAAPEAEQVNWTGSYQAALERGAKEGRPLAVFIGKGSGDANNLVREGKLNEQVTKTLTAKYVCVFLDTDLPAHSELIKSFGFKSGRGLAISDRTGTIQVFFHDGQMAEADLQRELVKFADPNFQPTTTSSLSDFRISNYLDGNATQFPGSSCPNCNGGGGSRRR